MGLIRALAGSAVSTIRDMWVDYIYCDSLGSDILVKKGVRKSSPGGARGDENLITEGSKIAVNPGQVLIVVEDGKIIDFTAEPGGYEFKSSAAPSAFVGNFGEFLKITFNEMSKRFAYGGIAGVDQRAYFINAKEIVNNKFGFGNVSFRDSEFNISISLQGFGMFSYKIANPLTFFTNLSGNVADSYTKESLEPQIKAELQDALLPALGALAKEGVHYDELPSNVKRITEVLRDKLDDTWYNKRGIEIVNLSLTNIKPDEKSVEQIRLLQEARAYSSNKAMLGARVGVAQANAMETAAGNAAGATAGFMGMQVAQNAGNVNVSELLKEEPSKKAEGNSWVCECGTVNTSKFCGECGKPKPLDKCPNCGASITPGKKFCGDCGHKLI